MRSELSGIDDEIDQESFKVEDKVPPAIPGDPNYPNYLGVDPDKFGPPAGRNEKPQVEEREAIRQLAELIKSGEDFELELNLTAGDGKLIRISKKDILSVKPLEQAWDSEENNR